MSYGVKLHIRGDFFCFTRREMKVERVSYVVITLSAARGILEAIDWKPQIWWVIDPYHMGGSFFKKFGGRVKDFGGGFRILY